MRSEKRKQTDREYRKRTKSRYKRFSTEFRSEEYDTIQEILCRYHINKAQLIRRAIENLSASDTLGKE